MHNSYPNQITIIGRLFATEKQVIFNASDFYSYCESCLEMHALKAMFWKTVKSLNLRWTAKIAVNTRYLGDYLGDYSYYQGVHNNSPLIKWLVVRHWW